MVEHHSSQGRGNTDAAAADRIHRYLIDCADAMVAAAIAAPEIEGANAFATAIGPSQPKQFSPGWLSTLDTIGSVPGTDQTDQASTAVVDGTAGRELAERFKRLAPLLPWIPTTRADDGGTEFALSPLNKVRKLSPLTVGFMYVRPGSQYPVHRHKPQELYLTISGEAQWRFGGNDDYRPLGPLSTVYNHPDDLHSAIAGQTPLVALYVLWS